MTANTYRPSQIEPLEARIAPAALIPTDASKFVKATLGGPIELNAGDILTSTGVPGSGSYLLFVEEGNALVFFTDLNNNKTADYNELTGISAGDGLRLISFIDIHGDIVTNLVEKTVLSQGGNKTLLSLTDSDSNPANDSGVTGGDGRIVLNKTIEKIELRSLTVEDLTDQDGDGDVDDVDVGRRKAPSTYSIFGSIFAGGGFGADDGGLLINPTGLSNFGFIQEVRVSVGAIRVGSAVSGEFFTFGASRADDTNGILLPFIPQAGQIGGSINGVKAVNDLGALNPGVPFNIDGLYAGDGGPGAKGGDIKNIFIGNDDTSGYDLVAGNGGRGASGGDGGSIVGLTDFGSNTGKIRILTGNGGTGATGTGGNGGNLDFESFNVLGEVLIDLGDGGDGFRVGGDGASLVKGRFLEPSEIGMFGRNFVGTTHVPSSLGGYVPRIGTNAAVDFDLDGFGDFVYTTSNGSQLIVGFGDPVTQERLVIGPDGVSVQDRIHLAGPHNAEALVVADLNNDGIMDIATASFDNGAQGGIYVYLGYFEDRNLDGELTTDEDRNGNGVNDFVGFSSPIHSPLPQLERGDPETSNAIFDYWESPIQVSELVAGDFNGDGLTELAAIATFYTRKLSDSDTNETIELDRPDQVLLFLEPDVEVNNSTGLTQATGQFYADFGTKREEFIDPVTGEVIVIPAAPLQPFFAISVAPSAGEVGTATIDVTAISTLTSTFDSVIVAQTDNEQNSIVTINYALRTPVGAIAASPVQGGIWNLGRVDTNRQPPSANNANINLDDFKVKDFTVFDYDNDNVADLVAVSLAPAGFAVGVKGNGTGGGAQVSSAADGQNAGDFFGQGDGGYDIGPDLVAVKAVSMGALGVPDGLFNDYAVISGGGQNFGILEFVAGGDDASDLIQGVRNGRLEGDIVLDVHYYAASDISEAPAVILGNVFPLGNVPALFFTDLVSLNIEQTIRGISLLSGDGGDALIGSGGVGGSIGSGAKIERGFDIDGNPVSKYTGSVDFLKTGFLRLIAGAGGEGFGKGGRGGDINGITSALPNNGTDAEGIFVTLTAGNGGRGVTGTGGSGGNISQISSFGGSFLTAGDGGPGVIGGNGGNVLGNGTSIPDLSLDAGQTLTTVRILAGDGGSGTKRAGNGGSIQDFHPKMNAETDSGAIAYVAGDGGASVRGRGGDGGSVLNSSPFANAVLEGEIYVEAGDGGIGTVGGTGGSIKTFAVNLTGLSKEPTILSFIAGAGGFGTRGNGGNGGSVSDVDVSSRGSAGAVGLFFPTLNIHEFNRVLGGDGGASARGKGGNGGSVMDVRTSADQNGYAIIAGAGGDGLRAGGTGGSLKLLDVTFGASTTAKGLFIAGAGGNASSFIPNPNEPNTPNQPQNSFGGKIGRGGNGGSIIGLEQRGNTAIHVDIIAGNGGDTINYGSIVDKKNFVGKGGSIQSVTLAGDAGNISPAVGIKGYNDLLGGESLAEYVIDKFRDRTAPLGTVLSDGDGNVGIVVGAAGRNKAVVIDPVGNPFFYESQPAQGAQNGSLTNILVKNLMSAVAGSVDRIASIQLSKNIQVPNGIVGADKPILGQNNYLNKDGTLTDTGTPVRDGILVDGAFVTRKLVDINNRPTNLTGRVFFL